MRQKGKPYEMKEIRYPNAHFCHNDSRVARMGHVRDLLGVPTVKEGRTRSDLPAMPRKTASCI